VCGAYISHASEKTEDRSQGFRLESLKSFERVDAVCKNLTPVQEHGADESGVQPHSRDVI
jgi:hypothetical protein